MVVALIEMNFILADFFIKDRFRISVVTAAVGPYAAVFAFKRYAAAFFVRDNQFDAVGVFTLIIILNRSVVDGVFGEFSMRIFHGDRAGILRPHAPLGNVGMMAAPVGNLPAGVIQVPTEIHADAGRAIIINRGRPQPVTVIKPFWDWLRVGAVGGFAEVGDAARQAATHGV